MHRDLLNPSDEDANPGTNRCYSPIAHEARWAGLYSLCSQVPEFSPFSVMLILMQKSELLSSGNGTDKSALSKL